ncbi:hypothetical protein BG58_39405 [Caballeronia jiangsuensis]|nr:hypothetical protein BG58_39405 [Caballeronia jiangsuensis]
MPNEVEFIVPNPANLPLNYALAPANFRAQFVPMAAPGPAGGAMKLSLPNPANPIGYLELLVDALDSGYGSNAAPMPAMPLTDRVALYLHLAAQLRLAHTLIKKIPNGPWVLQPFTVELEKTAKTTHSYLLGMLYASVAARLWGQANGWGNIREFWHYGVLTSSAANFADNFAYKEENPDFLVEFDGGGGTWACVEAKGTLKGQDNLALRKGLRQACKLLQVQWQNVGSPVTVVVPAQQACAMTYFDPTLEVLLMDPPSDRPRRSTRDSKAPLFFKQGGDLVRWGQALDQFEALAAVAEGQDPRLQLERFDWALESSLHDVWVGVPKIMRKHAGPVNSALCLLDWLVPVLGAWRKKPSVTARGVNMRLGNMARYASGRANTVVPESTDNQISMWARVALFLNELRRENREVFSWDAVLHDIWFLDLFRGEDSMATLGYTAVDSLEDLWALFTRAIVLERDQWEISDAATGGDGSNVSSAKTRHGLLVVALGPKSEAIVRTARRPLRP